MKDTVPNLTDSMLNNHPYFRCSSTSLLSKYGKAFLLVSLCLANGIQSESGINKKSKAFDSSRYNEIHGGERDSPSNGGILLDQLKDGIKTRASSNRLNYNAMLDALQNKRLMLDALMNQRGEQQRQNNKNIGRIVEMQLGETTHKVIPGHNNGPFPVKSLHVANGQQAFPAAGHHSKKSDQAWSSLGPWSSPMYWVWHPAISTKPHSKLATLLDAAMTRDDPSGIIDEIMTRNLLAQPFMDSLLGELMMGDENDENGDDNEQGFGVEFEIISGKGVDSDDDDDLGLFNVQNYGDRRRTPFQGFLNKLLSPGYQIKNGKKHGNRNDNGIRKMKPEGRWKDEQRHSQNTQHHGQHHPHKHHSKVKVHDSSHGNNGQFDKMYANLKRNIIASKIGKNRHEHDKSAKDGDENSRESVLTHEDKGNKRKKISHSPKAELDNNNMKPIVKDGVKMKDVDFQETILMNSKIPNNRKTLQESSAQQQQNTNNNDNVNSKGNSNNKNDNDHNSNNNNNNRTQSQKQTVFSDNVSNLNHVNQGRELKLVQQILDDLEANKEAQRQTKDALNQVRQMDTKQRNGQDKHSGEENTSTTVRRMKVDNKPSSSQNKMTSHDSTTTTVERTSQQIARPAGIKYGGEKGNIAQNAFIPGPEREQPISQEIQKPYSKSIHEETRERNEKQNKPSVSPTKFAEGKNNERKQDSKDVTFDSKDFVITSNREQNLREEKNQNKETRDTTIPFEHYVESKNDEKKTSSGRAQHFKTIRIGDSLVNEDGGTHSKPNNYENVNQGSPQFYDDRVAPENRREQIRDDAMVRNDGGLFEVGKRVPENLPRRRLRRQINNQKIEKRGTVAEAGKIVDENIKLKDKTAKTNHNDVISTEQKPTISKPKHNQKSKSPIEYNVVKDNPKKGGKSHDVPKEKKKTEIEIVAGNDDVDEGRDKDDGAYEEMTDGQWFGIVKVDNSNKAGHNETTRRHGHHVGSSRGHHRNHAAYGLALLGTVMLLVVAVICMAAFSNSSQQLSRANSRTALYRPNDLYGYSSTGRSTRSGGMVNSNFEYLG